MWEYQKSFADVLTGSPHIRLISRVAERLSATDHTKKRTEQIALSSKSTFIMSSWPGDIKRGHLGNPIA